jgi:hypothetical protein
MTYTSLKDKTLSTLTLFSSLSTMLCCALPAMLVAIGAGSVMAGLVSTLPELTVVSKYKGIVFIFAGIMLFLSGFMQWINRYAPCPLDPVQAEACQRVRKYSFISFGISLFFYTTGLFFAYIAPYFMKHFMPM